MIRDSGSMKVMMLIIPNDAKDDDDESPWMLLFCDSDYDDNANAYDVKVDGYDDGDDYDGDDYDDNDDEEDEIPDEESLSCHSSTCEKASVADSETSGACTHLPYIKIKFKC